MSGGLLALCCSADGRDTNSGCRAEQTGRARPSRLPELLAPAGDWDCARAAVENGADAIYFGLEKFNARMRAHNFTEADLPKLMEFLHRRGVRGYVTLNTLVFENELADAEKYLRAMIAAGVDAVIVQDVGICRLIRELSPDFPIHASTQMTITSAGGVEFARELGCNLVVLARECSIAEIEKINWARTSATSPLRHSSSSFPGGFRPRRVVRRLLRPMSHQRSAGRTLGQSRRMRAGLPDALRFDLRRQTGSPRRPKIFAQPARLGRAGSVAGFGSRRRRLVENRRPAQDAGIRRQHHADLPAGAWTIYDSRMTIYARKSDTVLVNREIANRYNTRWKWPFRAGFTPAGLAA